MTNLVLLRHGESVWNRDNRFTGWTDVELSPHGIRQARDAGSLLRSHGYRFDVCFTSLLCRATETLRIVLETMDWVDVPVRPAWQLNERHYGALQGLTRWQAIRKFGPRRVLRCQTNFHAPPPILPAADPRHAGLDPRYAQLADHDLPRGESLHDTILRVRPYWQREIAPAIRQGKRILIVSHRNTLSVIVKLIEDVEEQRAARLKLPTGKPLVYHLDAELRRRDRYFLSSQPQPGPSINSIERTAVER